MNTIESYYDAGRNTSFIRCSCWIDMIESCILDSTAINNGWYQADQQYQHAEWCEHAINEKKPE